MGVRGAGGSVHDRIIKIEKDFGRLFTDPVIFERG
jgi:hypothetical protein